MRDSAFNLRRHRPSIAFALGLLILAAAAAGAFIFDGVYNIGADTPHSRIVYAILQELRDASLKLMQGESASHGELLSKVRPLRMNADKKIREILSDDQKHKLDQYLQGPHSEMHGNLSGATPRATGKPKP